MKKSKKQKGKEPPGEDSTESQPAFPGIRMHILTEKDTNQQFNKLLASIRSFQPDNETKPERTNGWVKVTKSSTKPLNGVVSLKSMKLQLSAGAVFDQGKREYMEDRVVYLQDQDNFIKYSYYAVFDGHSGSNAAIFCEENLHKIIVNQPSFATGDVPTAIQEGFREADKNIIEKGQEEKWTEGCCATAVFISENVLFVGNVGDSHAILGKLKGEKITGTLLTEHHHADVPSEKQRILSEGGMVVRNRVFGDLLISRSLGDLNYKIPKQEKNFVSPEPYLNRVALNSEYSFLIVASDGLWDKFSYDEAAEFTYNQRNNNLTPEEICKLLLDETRARGSGDNTSIIVVFFDWSVPERVPEVKSEPEEIDSSSSQEEGKIELPANPEADSDKGEKEEALSDPNSSDVSEKE